MKFALLFTTVALVCVALVYSLSPLKLSIRPQICLAPCYVRLSLRVERDEANVLLRVLVDGPITRYSEIPLAATSPALFTLDYKDLPAGTYAVTADLVRHNGRSWIAGSTTGTVEVAGAQ